MTEEEMGLVEQRRKVSASTEWNISGDTSYICLRPCQRSRPQTRANSVITNAAPNIVRLLIWVDNPQLKILNKHNSRNSSHVSRQLYKPNLLFLEFLFWTCCGPVWSKFASSFLWRWSVLNFNPEFIMHSRCLKISFVPPWDLNPQWLDIQRR